MKMNDIQETIGQIWSSILPSVVRISLMIIVTFLLVPFSEFIKFVQPSLENGINFLSQEDVQAIMTFYGLDKLMPFVVLFLFLLAIAITDRLIFVISPLWFMDINLLEHNIFLKKADREDLAFIWAGYPKIETTSELEYLIDYLVTKENPIVKQVTGVDYWYTKKNESYSVLEYLKFLNLWIIAVSIFSMVKGYLPFWLFIGYFAAFLLIQYLVISYIFYQRTKLIILLNEEKLKIAKSFVMNTPTLIRDVRVDELKGRISVIKNKLPKSDVDFYYFGIPQKRWAYHVRMRLNRGKGYVPRQNDKIQLFLVNLVMRTVDFIKPFLPKKKRTFDSRRNKRHKTGIFK